MRAEQLELRPRTWGGTREGAGRPRTSGRIPHRRRGDLAPTHPCHVTLKTVAGVPSLRYAAWLADYERAFAAECERKGFRLCHYSVQENHFHLVCEGDDRRALWRGVQRLAARLARAINRRAGRRGRVFADRYHRRTMTTPTEVRNALAYALLNRNRHLHARGQRAGLATLRHFLGPALADARAFRASVVRADPFTSARAFDGWRRAPPPDPRAQGLVPVCRPRSWLLRAGWRRARAGLIDRYEVPG